jgi:hypothetical protein
LRSFNSKLFHIPFNPASFSSPSPFSHFSPTFPRLKVKSSLKMVYSVAHFALSYGKVALIILIQLNLIWGKARASDDSTPSSNGIQADLASSGLNVTSLSSLASSIINGTSSNETLPIHHHKIILYWLRPFRPLEKVILRQRRQDPVAPVPAPAPATVSEAASVAGLAPGAGPAEHPVGPVPLPNGVEQVPLVPGATVITGADSVGYGGIPHSAWKKLASPVLISMLMPLNVGANAAAVGAMTPAAAGALGSGLAQLVSNPIISASESQHALAEVNSKFGLPLVGVNLLDAKLQSHNLNVIS